MKKLILTAAALALTALSAQAQDYNQPRVIAGPLTIIDADTVRVGAVRVRLLGVDAPEKSTLAGYVATVQLLEQHRNSDAVCILTGAKTHKREVGTCWQDRIGPLATSLNATIVSRGYALACPRFSTLFVPFEQTAALATLSRAAYCMPGRGAALEEALTRG